MVATQTPIVHKRKLKKSPLPCGGGVFFLLWELPVVGLDDGDDHPEYTQGACEDFHDEDLHEQGGVLRETGTRKKGGVRVRVRKEGRVRKAGRMEKEDR
jgi:hypothetical protein